MEERASVGPATARGGPVVDRSPRSGPGSVMTATTAITVLLGGLLLLGCPSDHPGDDDTGDDDAAADDDDATADDDTTTGADCGDGVVEGDEQCDDGGLNSDDTPDACRTDCTWPVCGDDVVDPSFGEVCDDGNTVPDDGCSEDCGERREFVALGVQGTNYDVARDASGQVHLLYKNGGSLFYGTITGGVLQGPEEIPDSSNVHVRFTRPRLAVRPDGGTIHTCWIQSSGEGLVHVWRDTAGSWHRETAWSDGSGDTYIAVPSIGVDQGENVHVVAQNWWFTSGEATESGAMYLRKPSGGSWSDEGLIHYVSGDNWRDTSMFTDLDGGIHATWKSANDPGKYRTCVSGASLTSATTVDIPIPAGENTVSFGDTFVTASGDVYHAYFAYPNQSIQVAVKVAGASSFDGTDQVAVADNDEHAGYENPWPAIAVDDGGLVWVSWAENRGAATVAHVMLAVGDGDGWTVEEIDGAAAIDAEGKPALTAVGHDVYLVWRAGDGSLRLALLARAT